MAVTVSQAVFLVASVCVYGGVQACSPPIGWKSVPMEDRLKEADIVLHGRFDKITEMPGSRGPYDLAVETTVFCELKNTANITIEKVIRIWDTSRPYKCVNNMVYVEAGKAVIMQLYAQDYETEHGVVKKLEFSSINVQGAVYDATPDIKRKVSNVEGLQHAYPPSGSDRYECDYPFNRRHMDMDIPVFVAGGSQVTPLAMATLCVGAVFAAFFNYLF